MMHRLVFVKHESNFKEYLYEMPLNAEVKAGGRVQVRNSTGETDGVAVTASFLVDEAGLTVLKKRSGCAGKNLARVIGTYAVILFPEERPASDTAVTSSYNPRLECMTCPFKKVPVTCAPCNACPHNGELQK